ncbi:MAG: DUF2071 domain-containing protein [Acidimicrobiales bacterium]
MTSLPALAGTIERRLLINYRVDRTVLERILPSPFRPQLVEGVGLAGICLIRLANLRPVGLPPSVGLMTENAAHRVAVEWDGPDGPLRGVYIPRRDTSSRLTVVLGGRLFPGEHHRARFEVRESARRFEVAFQSLDATASVSVDAKLTSDLDVGSVFRTLEVASTFFEGSPIGYSATNRAGCFEGLELHSSEWHVDPVGVDHVESSFFSDAATFPAGSTEFDSALIMRDIPVVWQAREKLESRWPDVPTAAGPITEESPCG